MPAPLLCPSCGEGCEPMEYDPALRAHYCTCCGRLWRLTAVPTLRGYAPADRALVGAEDGDHEP